MILRFPLSNTQRQSTHAKNLQVTWIILSSVLPRSIHEKTWTISDYKSEHEWTLDCTCRTQAPVLHKETSNIKKLTHPEVHIYQQQVPVRKAVQIMKCFRKVSTKFPFHQPSLRAVAHKIVIPNNGSSNNDEVTIGYAVWLFPPLVTYLSCFGLLPTKWVKQFLLLSWGQIPKEIGWLIYK